jgi:hypothetical protein
MPTALMPVDVGRLHGADTPRFAVLLTALPRRSSEGIGGAVFFYEAAAQIGFRHEDGSVSFLEVPVQLAEPEIGLSLPSVLGFTALASLVLHIDGPSLTVTLDAPGLLTLPRL